MNKYCSNFFTLLFAILLLNACKKDEHFTTAVDLEPLAYFPDSAICTATKQVPGLGSIAWKATGSALLISPENTFAVRASTYEDTVNWHLRESMGIYEIPAKKGRYVIEEVEKNNIYSAYTRFVSDGDVVNALWEIDPDKDNFVEVVALDENTQTLQVRFDVHYMMRLQGSFGMVHSERINFKNGNLTVKYTQ